MTRQIAVDTSVLVALVDKRDRWHRQADEMLAALESRPIKLIYFDSVVNESVSVLARRMEEQRRSGDFPTVLDTLLRHVPPPHIAWLSRETQQLYDQVIDLVRESGGALNFHDSLIALACRDLRIRAIASFDADFDRVKWLTRVTAASEITEDDVL